MNPIFATFVMDHNFDDPSDSEVSTAIDPDELADAVNRDPALWEENLRIWDERQARREAQEQRDRHQRHPGWHSGDASSDESDDGMDEDDPWRPGGPNITRAVDILMAEFEQTLAQHPPVGGRRGVVTPPIGGRYIQRRASTRGIVTPDNSDDEN